MTQNGAERLNTSVLNKTPNDYTASPAVAGCKGMDSLRTQTAYPIQIAQDLRALSSIAPLQAL